MPGRRFLRGGGYRIRGSGLTPAGAGHQISEVIARKVSDGEGVYRGLKEPPRASVLLSFKPKKRSSLFL